MLLLTKELLDKCKQKRKESYFKKDLHNYIKYSSIMMPEDLGVSIKKCAEFFGYSLSSIYRIRGEYAQEEKKIKLKTWGGRRRSLLSISDELDLIKSFRNEVNQGKSLIFQEIKARIENKVGKTMHKTSIYRLLDRHGSMNIITKTKSKIKKLSIKTSL